MKKNNNSSIVTAAVLGLPLAALPSVVAAQTPAPISKQAEISTPRPLQAGTIKLSPILASIVGMQDGHPVYTNPRGEYFFLDPKTGDFHYLTKEQASAAMKEGIALAGKGRTSNVTIVGIDASGNVIQKNAKGETFYLNSKTGDMVFVK